MGTVVGEDRISELPDPILHHILCFLPTKCSVSTSILSKRWRYLWTSIPVLDFREWRSLSDKLGSLSVDDTAISENYDLENERFMNFVNRMLSLHDDRPTTQKFYFYSDDDFDESRVIAWISTLIRHKVEELILSLEDDIHQFPPCFSTCESLTMLDLEAVTNLKLPFSFPRLKILRLTYIRFVDEKLTQQFFSNCPVLEELILTSCKWVGMGVVSISAPALKCLYIIGTSLFDFYGLDNCVVKIYAPSLLSLKYREHVAKDYVLSSFSSLVDANIDFDSMFVLPPDTREKKSYRANKLLGGLSNVKLLKMSGETFKVLSFADDLLTNLPTFCNLIHLKVSRFLCSANRTLLDFLQITPNLESLVFAEGFGQLSNDDDSWTLDLVPQPSWLRLKSVEFHEFFGRPNELNGVKFILKNACVLQKVTILSPTLYANNKVEEVKEQLLMFPRASTGCVINFTSSNRF